MRRKRMVTHHAANYQDAEEWDLTFWQKQSPEDRLSALVAIHNDIANIEHGKEP